MAYETGGYANKLGNRYELRWVVRQYLQVMVGELRSVTVEAVGDDEEGVDLWVERNDERREAQQCKGALAAKAMWTVSDLQQKGILLHLRDQLTRNEMNEFCVVSATPAPIFRDLTQSARDSTGDPVSFYKDQVQRRSKKHRREFENFCKYLSLSTQSDADLQIALDLLSRSDFHHFCDDRASRAEMRTFASLLIAGDAESALSVLASFALDNLRKTIYADDLFRYLETRGFTAIDLSRNGQLVPRVDELRRQFSASLAHQLAGGILIPRKETQEILRRIESAKQKQIVVLHGSAGDGKSGVLFEFASELEKRGIPHLPLRLDRQIPSGNPRTFGDAIGLPDSPVACLRAVAGQRPAVLILDQLDALRWTSAHAASALPVCEEMIRQALLSPNIFVVISCRTFDLNNDPQLTSWQSGKQIDRIEVGQLEEQVVRNFVTQRGAAYENLLPRQRQLLRSIHNLAMWAGIALGSEVLQFTSATELIRQFWHNRRREMASRGVAQDEIDRVANSLTQYMDSNSRQYAPFRLVEHYAKAVAELQSLNVIQVIDGRVSFCHQTYLDYLIAVRLLSEIDSNVGAVLGWLGNRSGQTLFRREQLRLALHLLHDEAPSAFSETLKSLVESVGVRFHLKHLALQVTAQVDDPTDADVTFVASLLEDDWWRPHTIDQLLRAKPCWFDALDRRGLWQEWLASENDERIRAAVGVLRVAAPQRGNRVASLLVPYVASGGNWPRQIMHVLPRDAAEESAGLFQIRLELARRGICDHWCDWPGRAKSDPHGFVDLLQAYIAHCTENLSRFAQQNGHDAIVGALRSIDREKNHTEVLAIASMMSVDEWGRLLTEVGRFSKRKQQLRRRARANQKKTTWLSFPRLPRSIRIMLVTAGRSIIRRDPRSFLAAIETQPLKNVRAVQRIVAASFVRGPLFVADDALQWLMTNPKRLRLGGGQRTTPWEPARQVIRSLAFHCSPRTYAELQSLLINHHDPDEFESFQWKIRQAKEGWYETVTLFGQTQFHLLPALPTSRMSVEAKGLEGVMHRKFTAVADRLWPRRRRVAAGFMGSSISAKRLDRLSDRAWLEIINSRSIRADGTPRIRSSFKESSVHMFARDLHTMTCRQPKRFAELALRIPSTATRNYIESILSGLETDTAPAYLSDEAKARWEPATAEEIERVLRHAGEPLRPDHAKAFCRLIAGRNDAEWSDETVGHLVEIATHHVHPSPGEYVVHGGDDDGVHHLETNAINVARGVAARAVEQLLWSHPDWLDRLSHALDALVNDPHPAVRVAAIGACTPILNIDRRRAVDWFINACGHDDSRVLGCRDAQQFLHYAAWTNFEEIEPLIQRMINCGVLEVEQAGAFQATARWLIQEQMHDDAEQCLNGLPHQRLGVAEAAQELVSDERCGDQCRTILARLVNDVDADVRKACNHLFYRKDILAIDGALGFVRHYANSAAFKDDPTVLLYALKDHVGTLLPISQVVFDVCDIFSGPLADSSRDTSYAVAGDAGMIAPLLLRLYEQAETDQSDIRQRCLDAWDELLRNRVGDVASITDSLSR